MTRIVKFAVATAMSPEPNPKAGEKSGLWSARAVNLKLFRPRAAAANGRYVPSNPEARPYPPDRNAFAIDGA